MIGGVEFLFFFSSRRRHTRSKRDWSSDVCSSDLFNAAAFRAIEVGARLAAPMALVWGLAELTAKSFGVRFGSRLGLAALTAIAGVVLASDPLSGVTFTVAWPTAADHYQFIPNVVLVVIAAATVIPALAALAVAAVRARREP